MAEYKRNNNNDDNEYIEKLVNIRRESGLRYG